MEITLAVLADYAATTDQGKLVVAGVFDAIRVPKLPATHPLMALALRVHARAGEEREHEIAVRLVDPDGRQVLPELKTKVSFPEFHPTDGANMQIVLQMPGVGFEKLGDHALDVFIDGRHETSLPLRVREAKGARPTAG